MESVLTGHQTQWEFLKKSAHDQKLAHAYLFSGPEKVGKGKVALELVKLLHCQDKDFEKRPCNTCSGCRMVSGGIHPDALFLSPYDHQKNIQISQVRELIYKLYLKPFVSSCKTVIIDRADLMNAHSQNCLLKTLEEPQGNTVLILITAHAQRLFPTVRSRAQEIRFLPVAQKEIERFLKSKGVAQTKAKEIAGLCLGRPGRAMEFVKDPQKLKREKRRIEEFIKVLQSGIGTCFQYAQDLSKKPLEPVFGAWLIYFREFLLFKAGSSKEVSFTPDFLQNTSIYQIKKIIENIETFSFLISTKNINKRLALETLMLNLRT